MDEAFLRRSIASDPVDDTVRLAYADLLQEHGDEARAEFIRLQIKAYRTACPQAMDTALVLWLQHRHKWCSDLVPCRCAISIDDIQFERGFLHSFACNLLTFLTVEQHLLLMNIAVPNFTPHTAPVMRVNIDVQRCPDIMRLPPTSPAILHLQKCIKPRSYYSVMEMTAQLRPLYKYTELHIA